MAARWRVVVIRRWREWTDNVVVVVLRLMRSVGIHWWWRTTDHRVIRGAFGWRRVHLIVGVDHDDVLVVLAEMRQIGGAALKSNGVPHDCSESSVCVLSL